MGGKHRVLKPEHYHNKRAGYCRWCGKEILDPRTGQINRRRTWHSECAEAYNLANTSDAQRRVCYDRDKGVCAKCGVDTELQKRVALDTRKLWFWLACRHYDEEWRRGVFEIVAYSQISQKADADVEADIKCRGWGHIKSHRSPWQADHIKPLCEANGDPSFFTAENLQTLCHRCHAEKTREDVARLRQSRKKDKSVDQSISGTNLNS